jgi:hypothetical protein
MNGGDGGTGWKAGRRDGGTEGRREGGREELRIRRYQEYFERHQLHLLHLVPIRFGTKFLWSIGLSNRFKKFENKMKKFPKKS